MNAAALLLLLLFSSPRARAQDAAAPLLPNGDFEEGLSHWKAGGWHLQPGQVVFSTSSLVRHKGRQAAEISHPFANDTFLSQEAVVEPDTIYKLSGWIKTRSVEGKEGPFAAVLTLDQSWLHTESVSGTQDWQQRVLWLRTGPEQRKLGVLCRLGFWSSSVSGQAWFDDVRLEKVDKLPRGAEVRQLQGEGERRKPSSAGYWIAIAILAGCVIASSWLLRRWEPGR